MGNITRRVDLKSKNIRIDSIFFLLVLLAYLAGQALIGTYSPERGEWHYDAPADVDFLYYAGIINQMEHSFPPQNPAYGGVPLSQSFIQYYPTVLVAQLAGPYPAMRILNLLYLLLLAYLFRRYFFTGWGVGLTVIAAGSVGFGLLNSLGVDLIARGFNHFPFFVALTVALFEREKKWLAYGCLFLLGWLHSYSALLVAIYFCIIVLMDRFSRQSVIRLALAMAGLASAAILTLGVADKPFYFPFVEGFGFDLTHLWPHALAAAILIIPTGNYRVYTLGGVAFIFGLVFHYNPFFPVFILYFSAGWAAMVLYTRETRRPFTLVVVSLLFIGFLVGATDKYDPRDGGYVPINDLVYNEAGKWLEENSSPEAVILTVPLDGLQTSRLMEKRALYLGFIPHVAHLGIDWRGRAEKLSQYFANPPVHMLEADYVIYGPAERQLFPTFSAGGKIAYVGEYVKIWKLK